MDNTQKTNREKERVQKNNISRETEGERERWNKNERTEQWKREKVGVVLKDHSNEAFLAQGSTFVILAIKVVLQPWGRNSFEAKK